MEKSLYYYYLVFFSLLFNFFKVLLLWKKQQNIGLEWHEDEKTILLPKLSCFSSLCLLVNCLVAYTVWRVNEVCLAFYTPLAYIALHIYRLSAYYGNLLGLSFEDASAISSRFQSGLEKCCLQPQPECIIEEVSRTVRPLRFHSMLCSTNHNEEHKGSNLSWDNYFDQISFWQWIFLFRFIRHLMIWQIRIFFGGNWWKTCHLLEDTILTAS